LGQVLTNLVQNSLDAVRDSKEEPRVQVLVEPADNDHFRICVRDNGPGVPEELIPRLFEPYVTTKANGTGLGLSIVSRIVVEHGGEITYEPGHGGACFVVTLPIAGPLAGPSIGQKVSENASERASSHALGE
jgi:signal transduction histidine kinase